MGEYEDWVKRQQAAESASRQSADRFRAEVEKQKQINQQVSRATAEAETWKKYGPVTEKLKQTLRSALSSEFARARENKIYHSLRIDTSNPVHCYSNVYALWGKQLEISRGDKEIVEGRRQIFKNRPEKVLDHSYNELQFQIGYGRVALYYPLYTYTSEVPIDQFESNPQSVFPMIRAGLEKGCLKEEYWEWCSKGGHNNYMTLSAINEWYRIDAMDG